MHTWQGRRGQEDRLERIGACGTPEIVGVGSTWRLEIRLCSWPASRRYIGSRMVVEQSFCQAGRSAAFVDVFTGSGSDTSEARTCIRIEGGETVLTVTEYRVTNYLRLKAGDPVVLEIDTPKKVRDLRQGDPPGIVDIAELGDDITRMLRVRGGAAVGK